MAQLTAFAIIVIALVGAALAVTILSAFSRFWGDQGGTNDYSAQSRTREQDLYMRQVRQKSHEFAYTESVSGIASQPSSQPQTAGGMEMGTGPAVNNSSSNVSHINRSSQGRSAPRRPMSGPGQNYSSNHHYNNHNYHYVNYSTYDYGGDDIPVVPNTNTSIGNNDSNINDNNNDYYHEHTTDGGKGNQGPLNNLTSSSSSNPNLASAR